MSEHDDSSARALERAHAPKPRPRGFRAWARRLWTDLGSDRVSMAASSVAFWTLLSVFPALLGLVSLYGLWADPADVQAQMQELRLLLPATAERVLHDRLIEIAETSESSLGIGAVISFGSALWLASGGAHALITALGVVFAQEEERGWLRIRAIALGLTVGALATFAAAFLLLGALPLWAESQGAPVAVMTLLTVGRWLALALLTVLLLSVVYRFGAARRCAKWHGVTGGSVVGTAVWIVATAVFSLYVQHAGNYDETYGAVGGVIVLLLWLYVSAYAVLIGAEIDSATHATSPLERRERTSTSASSTVLASTP